MRESDDIIEEVSRSVCDYCESTLLPLVTERTGFVQVCRSRSREFNARVETIDGSSYTIYLNDGVVIDVRDAVSTLAETSHETIDDVIDNLAIKLLGDAQLREAILRQMIHGAIFFVVLHEVSHITNGHFSRLMAESPSARRFRFDEIDDTRQNADLSDADVLERNFVRICELEADAVAMDLMNVAAFELLEAGDEIRDILKVPLDAEVPNGIRTKASELMFYSACVGVALIEAKREVTRNYPLPFTRLFNIADMFVRRRISADSMPEPDGPNVTEIVLDDSKRRIIGDTIIPAIFSAIEICAVCCESAGHDLSKRFGWEADPDSVPGKLAADFAELMRKIEPTKLATPEANELMRLRMLRGAFAKQLQPFRMKLSYR